MTLLIVVVLLVGVGLFLLRKKAAAPSARPPGTAGLDEETAVRPDIDPEALARARATVSPAVPDEVLSDALLDATPRQLAQMFATVPTDVVTAALGKDAGERQGGQARAEDLAQLKKMGEAVDDLEIWSFGENR